VWLGNKLIFTKTSTTREDVSIPLTKGSMDRKLTVVSEGKQGDWVGLGGFVSVEM
jgi:hypothetical protein